MHRNECGIHQSSRPESKFAEPPNHPVEAPAATVFTKRAPFLPQGVDLSRSLAAAGYPKSNDTFAQPIRIPSRSPTEVLPIFLFYSSYRSPTEVPT